VNQKRKQLCFNCKKPEKLLVRYILNVHLRKKNHLWVVEEEKKTKTENYLFVCVNGKCWRHLDTKKLRHAWEMKTWSWRKLSPKNVIVREPRIKVGIS